MTTLLDKAFVEASQLPELEQNVLARWLLDEIHSEARWERAFAESEDILEMLANEAISVSSKPPLQTHPLNQADLLSAEHQRLSRRGHRRGK